MNRSCIIAMNEGAATARAEAADGGDYNHNPYEDGTSEYIAWQRGYENEIERIEAKKIKTHSHKGHKHPKGPRHGR